MRLVMGNSVSLAWNIPTPLLLILGKVLVGMWNILGCPSSYDVAMEKGYWTLDNS